MASIQHYRGAGGEFGDLAWEVVMEVAVIHWQLERFAKWWDGDMG